MLKRFFWLILIAAAGVIAWLWLRQRQDSITMTTSQFAPPTPASPTPADTLPGQQPATERAPGMIASELLGTSQPKAAAEAPQPTSNGQVGSQAPAATTEPGTDGDSGQQLSSEAPAPDATAATPLPPAQAERETGRPTTAGAIDEEAVERLFSDDTPDEQQPDSAAQTEQGGDLDEVVGYCVRCKTKRPIADAHEERTESDRRAARGTCPVCGANMFTFLPEQDGEEGSTAKDQEPAQSEDSTE